MDKKHIAIIGLGGVGGYFGFKISKNNEIYKEHHISFIARAKTYEKVKKEGLQLRSPEHKDDRTYPDAIHTKIGEIKNPDLVFICVKEYDLKSICKQLSEVITTNTVIIPMMNGADIYDRIRELLPNTSILPSCVYVASHIKEKGIVEHKGKTGHLIFGKDPKYPSLDIDWILDVMKHSNIHFDYKQNAQVAIWTKFIFIASFGLVTAKHNSSIGEVCTIPVQKEEATNIMQEIKLIADKKEIHLQETIISNTFEKAATFPPTTPTSLQLDIHSGKGKNELELFAGAILKYGKDVHVKTSCTERIYEQLKASRSNL